MNNHPPQADGCITTLFSTNPARVQLFQSCGISGNVIILRISYGVIHIYPPLADVLRVIN